MASRVTSAVMALIAAGLLAAAIFSQHWWSGFPTIGGATRHLQEIHVGPMGSELCNTGGDGTCEAMPIASTFRGVGYIVSVALASATVVLALLAVLALLQSEARRTVAKIGFVTVGASVVVSATMLVLGPTFDVKEAVTVPIGTSIFFVGAGGVVAIIAGLLARRRPRPIQLRSAPIGAMQFAAGQSPLDLIAGLEPGSPPPYPIALPSQIGPGAHTPGLVQAGFGNPLTVGPGYAAPGGFRVDAVGVPAPPVEGVTAPMNIPPPPAPNSSSFAVAHNPLAGGPSRSFSAPANPFGPGAGSQSYSVPSRSGSTQPPPMPPGPRSGSTQPPPFPGPTSTSPGVRSPMGAPPSSGPMAGRPGPSQPPPFGSKPTATSPGVTPGSPADAPLAFPGGPPLVVANLPPPSPPMAMPPRPFVLPVSPPSTPFGGPLPRPKTLPPPRAHKPTVPPLKGVVPLPAPRSVSPSTPPVMTTLPTSGPGASPPTQLPDASRDSALPTGMYRDDQDADGTSQTELPGNEQVGDMTTPSLDVDLPDGDLDALIPPPSPDSGAAMISATDAVPAPTFGSAPTITNSHPVVGGATDVMAAQRAPHTDVVPVQKGPRSTDVVPTLAGPVSVPMPAVSVTMVTVTAAPDLPPPCDSDAQSVGPSPACPQCEAPMAWVEAHLRFFCRSCKMYF